MISVHHPLQALRSQKHFQIFRGFSLLHQGNSEISRRLIVVHFFPAPPICSCVYPPLPHNNTKKHTPLVCSGLPPHCSPHVVAGSAAALVVAAMFVVGMAAAEANGLPLAVPAPSLLCLCLGSGHPHKSAVLHTQRHDNVGTGM